MSFGGFSTGDPLLASLMRAGVDPSTLSSLSSAPLPSAQPIGDDNLAALAATIDNYNSQTEAAGVRGIQDLVSSLELALTTTYKLAVLIRGDYDGHPPSQDQQKPILERFKQTFDESKQKAQDLRDALSKSSSEIKHLQRDELPAKLTQLKSSQDELRHATEEIRQSLDRSDQEIGQLFSTMNDIQHQYEDARARLNDLSNILPMLAFGNVISGRVNGSEDMVRDLEMRLRQTQGMLNDAQSRRAALNSQQYELSNKGAFIESQISRVSMLSTAAAAAVDRSNTLTTSADSLHEKTIGLSDLAGTIESRATGAAGSYKKVEFTSDILKLCNMALVNVRVVDEVQMICDELVSGYEGSQAPNEVLDLVKEVRTAAQAVQ